MSYQGHPDAEFSRLSSQIGANTELLSKNVSTMQRLVNQPSNQAHLLKLQHTTNLLARDTNSLIKDLTQLPHPANLSERRQRTFMRDRLTNDFSEALRNFQVVQRAIKAVEPAVRDRNSHVLIDLVQQQDGSTVDQQQLQQQQQQQLQQDPNLNLEELREREESVRKLEHDIVEVNHIFKDLATMIHNQGETVDSIESNIYRATDDISRGAQEIARAREYQDKSRRKKFYLAMIFFLIMFVIFLIAYYT